MGDFDSDYSRFCSPKISQKSQVCVVFITLAPGFKEGAMGPPFIKWRLGLTSLGLDPSNICVIR
jgi:hypothetical protein